MEKSIDVITVIGPLDMLINKEKSPPTYFGLTLVGWYLILAALFIVLFCCACGALNNLESYSHARVIELPEGMKLVNAKLEKDSSVWVFMESVDSSYIPKTKILQRESKYGIIEDRLIFREK